MYLTITPPDASIPELKIGLTDFYYTEGIDSFRFGIWCKKWDYDNVSEAFDITLTDQNGNRYDSYVFSIIPGAGVYETFQVREIRGLALHEVDQLQLHVAVKNTPEQAISVEVYDRTCLTCPEFSRY